MDEQIVKTKGGFNPLGLLITVAVGGIATVILGFLYGYLTSLIPFIMVNVFLAVGYGFAVGFAVGVGGLFGKIQSPGALALIGLAVGLFAVHMAWVGWIHANLQVTIWNPAEIWNGMRSMANEGIWSIGSVTPKGIVLWAVWATEAGIITILSAVQATTFVTDEFANTAK